MCDVSVLEFFIYNCQTKEFRDKRVLEVGSKYVNGSVRPFIEYFFAPKEYIGVDLESGKFVDIILPAERILEKFGQESFDVVISTELLEHVEDWKVVINNLKSVLRNGNILYITTRSKGFPYHGCPYDFWRFEIEDIMKIFSDFEILKLERDQFTPGIFLKARKPYNWQPVDLTNISIYSMILGRRTNKTPKLSQMPLSRKIRLFIFRIGWKLFSLIKMPFIFK